MAKKNGKPKSETNDADLDAMYESVLNCESAINSDDVEPLADLVRKNELVGIPWRLTAVIAGKDGTFFRNLSEDEGAAKALAPAVDGLYEFSNRLKKMAELAECVASRIMVAGCNHRNFNKWQKKAA